MDPELTKLDMLTSFENLFSVSSNLHRHKRLLCQNEKGINTKNRSSFWSDVEHFLHVCLYLIPLPFITDFLARAWESLISCGWSWWRHHWRWYRWIQATQMSRHIKVYLTPGEWSKQDPEAQRKGQRTSGYEVWSPLRWRNYQASVKMYCANL